MYERYYKIFNRNYLLSWVIKFYRIFNIKPKSYLRLFKNVGRRPINNISINNLDFQLDFNWNSNYMDDY